MSVWCLNCREEFTPTEVTDTDTPLCSDECADKFWESAEFEQIYQHG